MTTRDYEALVILRSAGTEQEVARTAAGLEEPIKKLGGRIDNAQNLGRRRLAFRILRQAEGYYYLLRFQAPTAQIVELERLLRLNDAVVRFIILSADELPASTSITARQSAPSRAGAATRS